MDMPFIVGSYESLGKDGALSFVTDTLGSGTYKVMTPRSHPRHVALPPNTIYRINTGAPLPEGADSVIMVEDTELVSATSVGEEETIKTLIQVGKGENVRKAGSDVKRGDLVIEKGALLSGTGGEIGTLVFVGRREVSIGVDTHGFD